MLNNFLLTLDDAPTGTNGESFLDIFTSNIAIIVYVALFTLAIIGIAGIALLFVNSIYIKNI